MYCAIECTIKILISFAFLLPNSTRISDITLQEEARSKLIGAVDIQTLNYC